MTGPSLIPRWKVVAATALHALLPAWLVASVADAALGGIHLPIERGLGDVLRFGASFLAGYGALATGAVVVTAIHDRWRPAAARPAASRRSLLAHAMAEGRGRFGPAGDAALATVLAIEALPDDDVTLRLAEDLALLIDTARTAMKADPARAAVVATATADALATIAAHATALRAAAGEVARSAAQAHINYINYKYDT